MADGRREPSGSGSPGEGWRPPAARLRRALEAAVSRRPTQAILFSGGLDTGILARLLAGAGRRPAGEGAGPVAVTVVVEGAPCPDLAPSRRMAGLLGLSHHVERVDLGRLEAAARRVIRHLDSFDPMTVRNQAVIQVALERLRELGVESAMTGDGADELFAGYGFLRERRGADLEASLRRLWKAMSFDSLPMGEALGLRMRAPFLEPSVRAVAEAVVPRWLVGPVPSAARRGPGRGEGTGAAAGSPKAPSTTGKWLLRKAFQGRLPEEILWRRKDPIEVGSGSAVLPEHYREAIPEAERAAGIEAARRDHGIRIRDAEHLRYFRLYLEERGAPDPGPVADKRCPDCRRWLPRDRSFCKRCGAWPVPDPGAPPDDGKARQ